MSAGSHNRVEVMHGVNLDQLGRRPSEHYGRFSLTELEQRIRQLVEFADLPFEPLAFQQHILGVGLEFQPLPCQRLPHLVGGRHRLGVAEQAGLTVQQGALRLGFQQGLMRMLAVDIDQHLAQLAQLRGGGGDAVDEGLGAASIVDHPAQQHPALVAREFIGRQPVAGRAVGGELGADIGLAGAVAHHAGIAAPAQRQHQRMRPLSSPALRLHRQIQLLRQRESGQ